jgi:hypothetical protein
MSTSLGMRYVAVPVSRKGIRLEDVIRFYEVIYERGSAPIYTFSTTASVYGCRA